MSRKHPHHQYSHLMDKYDMTLLKENMSWRWLGNFFVKNTKEQRNFHVLVTATSSVHIRRFLRDIDSQAEVAVMGYSRR